MSNVDSAAMTRYEAVRDELAAELRDLQSSLNAERGATVGEIRQRLENDPFVLAVVGEFSSGKSYLLNALLERFEYETTPAGRQITGLLATDINPSTATITRLEYGDRDEATAEYESGRTERIPLDALRRFVAVGKTETGTLHAATGDEDGAPIAVRLKAASPFLRRGFVLADTPGLASANPAHRRATLQFLPSADAVLYLIDTQQPFTEGDASFLGIVRGSIDSIFIVQTKIDLWQRPQADGRPEWEHANERIARLAAIHAPGTYVYALSAREFAAGTLAGDPQAIAASRFPQFLAALDALLIARTGRSRLRRAADRAVTAIADETAAIDRDLEVLSLDPAALAARRDGVTPRLAALETRAGSLAEELRAQATLRRGAFDRRSEELGADVQRAFAQAFDTADIARLRDRQRLHAIVDRTLAAAIGEFAASAAAVTAADLQTSHERMRELPGLRWNLGDAAARAFGAAPESRLWSGDVSAAIAATIVLEAVGGPAIELAGDIAGRFASAPPGAYMKRELWADLKAEVFPRLQTSMAAFTANVGNRLQRIYDDLAGAATQSARVAQEAELGSIERALATQADGRAAERMTDLQQRRAALERIGLRIGDTIEPYLARRAEIEPADPGSAAVRAAHVEPTFDPASYDRGLRPERWRVAVLGALRRGKSSLINAIAGQTVLNDSNAGSARFPVHVRYAPTESAFALDPAGQWREVPFDAIAATAAQTAVLALVPWKAPHQLVLVHAPAFDSGDADAEDVNVAVASHASEVLCLFSRQLSDRELDLYERIAQFGRPLTFVHTIADNEAPDERRHVVELAKRYLDERKIPVERIFVVSAQDYDAAVAAGHAASGWNELGALRATLEAHAEAHMARLERREKLLQTSPAPVAGPANAPAPQRAGLLRRLFAGGSRPPVER